MLRSFILAVVPAIALAAEPKQLNMLVGNTTTLSMPAPVSAVKVEDPSLVEASKDGRKVSLVALARGTTEVTIVTPDGEKKLRVYVAADRYSMP